ncbi:MAG: hypothetical protein ACK4LQ_05360 [Pararhodobacter sp.]
MINIGNSLALLALLGWPLVVVVLFRTLSAERALIWTVLGGYMILPQISAINLPGIPALNKETIPNLSAFAACLFMLGRRPGFWPASWLGRILLVAFVLSPAVTVLTNLEPVRFGIERIGSLTVFHGSGLVRAELPGLRLYDSVSALANQFLVMLPLFLARSLLHTEAAIREIHRALVIAALLYAGPMLIEVRFSPQLHTWVYGFFQHDFVQAIRGGSYRPFVFMPHGLWVAFFAFMCAMAAMTLALLAPAARRGRMVALVVFTLGLVLLCRSFGPIALTLVFLPVLVLLRPRAQLALAAALALLVIAYPLLRGSGLVPTGLLVQQVAEISEDRAQSLEYRFTNEDRIIAHVEEKLLFGWGGWGRFVPHDPLTGTTRIVVDGQWIITIGHFGWLGYLALFGLLCLPLVSLWWQARRTHAPPVSLAVSALALILAANLLDLLPNATLIPFTWLMAGALLGHAEAMARKTAHNRARALAARHEGVVLGQVQPVQRPPALPRHPRTHL